MFTILVTLHIIVCLVLILVILLQAGKGAGLANIFGGGVQTLFGTKASTFLTRATAVCAIIFLLTCLGLGILSARRGRSLMEGEAIQGEYPLAPAEGEAIPAGPVETEEAPLSGPVAPLFPAE